MKRFKYYILVIFFSLFLGAKDQVFAALQYTAFEEANWTTVTEVMTQVEDGWLQSVCATDQYIVCLINASKKETDPDTLVAFYRNDVDVDGNPVEPYTYAFHITETDYEHGNGMTFNPNTREIAIAGLFTNGDSSEGAVFIVDADTLKFKRKEKVGNGSINFFGIDYIPERNQYLLMANRISDYSFYFTDENFDIVDKMNLNLSHSRSSFQDFCVDGDYIISIPYMQREGYMNIIDIYSISQQKRIGSYYLTLPDFYASVEPEGICQLESGHFILAGAMIENETYKLYETYIPVVYQIDTYAENGTITGSLMEVSQGAAQEITYDCESNYRLKQLIVDGTEQNIEEFPSSYVFQNVQSNHTIEAYFEEKPKYTIRTAVENGTVTPEVTVYEGESATIEFSPDVKYKLEAVLVDGVSLDINVVNNNYTFDAIQEDHMIEIRYIEIPLEEIVQAQIDTFVAENRQIIIACLGIMCIMLFVLIICMIRVIKNYRRRKRHRQRMLELRKKRLEEEMAEEINK